MEDYKKFDRYVAFWDGATFGLAFGAFLVGLQYLLLRKHGVPFYWWLGVVPIILGVLSVVSFFLERRALSKKRTKLLEEGWDGGENEQVHLD